MFVALAYQTSSSRPQKTITLPTAPRAARNVEIDTSRIPEHGPFTAFVGNLPYEVNESVLEEFFKDLAVRLHYIMNHTNFPSTTLNNHVIIQEQ